MDHTQKEIVSTPHVPHGFPQQRMIVLPRPLVNQALAHHLPMPLIPSDVGYFPKATNHYVERPAGSPQTIFILCVSGQGWLKIAGRHFDVLPGQLAVVSPNEAHCYGSGPKGAWTIYWCHAAGRAAGHFAAELRRRDFLPVFDVAGYLDLVPLFEQITDVLGRGYRMAHLQLAAMTLAHLLAQVVDSARSPLTSRRHQDMEAVIAYMRQRRHARIAVRELARLSNLSVSHFMALFKQTTGYAPLDYFIRLKMSRAAELLDTTTRPLKQIAGDVGFNDPLYFSRVFRRVYHVAPSEYRRTPKG